MKGREVFLGAALAAATLLMGEAICRAGGWFTASDSASEQPRALLKPMLAGSAELGWILRPGASGTLDEEDAFPRSFDAEGFNTLDSAQAHDARTPKVLFIGGSDVFGYRVPADRNLVEVTDALLPEAHAINLGVPGYSSAQGVLVAKKFIPSLRPRVAVFSFGFNDRRDAQDRQPDGPAQFEATYRASGEYLPNRIRRALSWSHLLRGLETLARRSEAPRQRGRYYLASARPRVEPARYAANLSEMADICVKFGVTPLFLLLGDSPTEMGPLHEAEILMAGGRSDPAIPILERLLTGPTERNVVRLALSEAYRKVGRAAEADKVLAEPVEFPDPPVDGMDPVRSDTEYNQVMRRVAEAKGVVIVDGTAIVGHRSDTFLDETHLSETGHRLLAESLAARIAALLEKSARSTGKESGIPARAF